MALADDIRAYAQQHFVGPQLAAHGFASLSVWDVHTAMHFHDRVPAVRSALEAQTFRQGLGLRLIDKLGPPTSSTTRFIFGPAERAAPPGSAQRQAAMQWFRDHAGEVVPWSSLAGHDPKLAIIPKGIYRPRGSAHALSIKIIPDGAYPDRAPELENGRLLLRYHQETPAGIDPATYFTNLGLRECMLDGVEVGVIRRRTPKPAPTYEVLGTGKVVDWSNSFFTVELLSSPDELAASAVNQPDPVSEEDARQRTLRSIVSRRGQAGFRRRLMAAYGGKCAISGCAVPAVLEAAHIMPFRGDHTNVVQNGLILRADLHTLFDLGLLKIHPEDRTVVLAGALQETEYWQMNGTHIEEPIEPADRPDGGCLQHAWQQANLPALGD